MSINARTATKAVVRFVVGSSVAYTITNTLRNTNTPDNLLEEAEVTVGAIAVGWVVSSAVEAKTDNAVDAIFNAFSKKN